MNLLRRLSIQKKLMLGMGISLALFVAISSVISIQLTSQAARERVFNVELPAQIGEMRNDILRQVAHPVALSRAIANDLTLQQWEDAGTPDSGIDTWKKFAEQVQQKNKVASVFWATPGGAKFFTVAGLDRPLTQPRDHWIDDLLSSGDAYRLNIDTDVTTGVHMMFINVRVETAARKLAVAGIGLSLDTLAQSIRSYHLGRSGHAYLVRGNGTVLVHRDRALVDGKHVLGELPGLSPELSKQLLGKEKFARARYPGADGMRMVVSSYLPELDAYVIAEVPESEVLGEITSAAMLSASIAGLVAGAIGLLVIFLISRTIAAPVMRAAQMLGDIARGGADLTRRMQVESEDEIGALATAFNTFVSSLDTTIGKVRSSTTLIASATQHIASGNANLSQRTESQASNIEQTAAAMEQLTSTVQQNADHAVQANKLVAATSESAVKGGAVVSQVVEMIGSITDSSHRMADIIGVIDGIAFQTNILALNAAVEAARAGEQGRGFAVVASEVRNLAQRSSAAAKEIRGLIVDSVEKVEAGSTLADTAGAAMREIVSSVRHVAELMTQITAASHEQSAGIVQVNQSIVQMDQATQQNSKLVEQAASAAQSLQDQAAQLTEVIRVFKLEEAETALLLH